MAGALTAAIAAAFSAAATDPYFEYTTLLLPGSGTNGAQNNTFLDGSTNNFTITRNGNTTQGTFSPFSQTGWSGFFDGTADFVSTPTGQTNLTLGTSDFTIEGWFYVGTQVQTNPALFTSDPGIGLANTIMIQFGSTLQAALFVNNVHLTASSTNNYLVSNQWNHIAVCRTGGSTYSYYINGVAVDNVASNSTSLTTNSWRVGYWTVSANAFTGYISNFRIINGTALYSGATITVPTAPLTAVANTQLLILQSNRFLDNSTNNFTITRNGDTRVVAFSPFNPTASWSAATYGGSGYFDGSGDYLSVPDNAALRFGTGDFCFETWVYLTALPASFGDLICKGTNNAGTFEISVISTGKLGFYTTVSVFQSVAVLTVNQWFHVALTRSGTTLRLFINGILDTTVTSFTTDFNNTGSLLAGAFGSGTGNNLSGYLSSYRCVKGDAVYTSNFTPPTAPPTAITNTSLLLNFTNAGIYDATSKNDLETVGDAQISNAVTPKWGSTSIKFDGTGDYLQMPDSELVEFGSADFTIEAWVYPTLITGANRVILGHGTSGTQWLAFYIDASGYLTFAAVSSSAVIDRTATSRAVSLNTWTHVAVSRSGSTFRLFIDGSEPTYTGSPSSSSSAMPNFATVFRIGAQRWDGDSGIFQGYLQDLRITKGYARYTANFTPPTAAFPTL